MTKYFIWERSTDSNQKFELSGLWRFIGNVWRSKRAARSRLPDCPPLRTYWLYGKFHTKAVQYHVDQLADRLAKRSCTFQYGQIQDKFNIVPNVIARKRHGRF